MATKQTQILVTVEALNADTGAWEYQEYIYVRTIDNDYSWPFPREISSAEFGNKDGREYFLKSREIDPGKYRLVRFRDKAWRKRERERILDGEYTKLPLDWDLEPIEDHYAHLSIETDTKIAFTPDATKGEFDIQVVMRPGRYLAKYYPHLGQDEVRRLALIVDKANELKFATTAEDIVAVYVGGPRSCMSHGADCYDSPVHPCAVYGDSDLQLAYLGDLNDASARALVRPSNKTYVRAYGDLGRIEAALATAGYRRNTGGFRGAKIQAIDAGEDRWTMPYIDGEYTGVDIIEDKFVICDNDDAEYSACLTTGLAGLNDQCTCDRCEDTMGENDYYIVRTGRRTTQNWCENCYSERAFYCDGSEMNYDMGSYNYVTTDRPGPSGASTFEQDWFESNGGFTCDRTGAVIFGEEAIGLEDTHETVCKSWAVDNAYYDEYNDLFYAKKPRDDDDEPTHEELEAEGQTTLPL